ncbi:hypothetical protein SCEN_N02640 [Saccharomyces cerevisiae]|nr:hypothetical protein SCEN_N02640 [Saccharomyces cerevisiae]
MYFIFSDYWRLEFGLLSFQREKMNYFKKRIGKGKGNRNMVGNFFFHVCRPFK